MEKLAILIGGQDNRALPARPQVRLLSACVANKRAKATSAFALA